MEINYVDQYVDDLGRRTTSSNTYMTYKKGVEDWHSFCQSVPIELNKVTSTHIFAYRDRLENKGAASNTIALKLKCVRSFYKWMIDNGHMNQNPYPIGGLTWSAKKETRAISVPAYDEIILMRQKRGVTIQTATTFEMLLSTGLRISEYCQVRLSDIDRTDIPFDKETMKMSEFVGGSITLLSKTHRIKTKKGRKVYFSKIAGKLLKKYIEWFEIKDDEPIFPWDRNNPNHWLGKLGDGIVEGYEHAGESVKEEKIVKRNLDSSDIDISNVKNPKFRKLLENRRKSKKSIDLPPEIKQQQEYTSQERRFHCHCLRHAFTCINRYRNVFGEREELTRLRALLGHDSASEATFNYLIKLDMITTDEQWNRIHRGRPTDWMGLVYPKWK